MRYSTISAIGSFTALSPASTDWLFLVPSECSGGGDVDLRTDVEDAPGADGGLIQSPLDAAQIITLSGRLLINSAGDDAGYYAAEDTLFASLKAALDAMKAAPDDLVHSGGSLSCWKYSRIGDGRDGLLKTVMFDLVVDVFA